MTVRPVSESPGARALAEGVTATVGPHAEQQPSSRRAPHRLQREVPIKTHFIRVHLQRLTDVDVVARQRLHYDFFARGAVRSTRMSTLSLIRSSFIPG